MGDGSIGNNTVFCQLTFLNRGSNRLEVYSVSVCDHFLLPRDERLEIKSQTRIRTPPPLIFALLFVWCSQMNGQVLVKHSGRTLQSTALHCSALQFIISTLYYNVVPWMSFEHLNRVAMRCLI